MNSNQTHTITTSTLPTPSSRYRRTLLALVLVVAVLLPACGSIGKSTGAYEYDSSCPNKHLITILDFDLSASGRAKALLGERLDDAQIEIERTGDCGGRLIAAAHSNSTAATVTLFDVELQPEGATEIARDRKLGPLVDDTMRTLRARLNAAMKRLSANGSDLTAGIQLISDQVSQHAAADTTIDATIYTDGISNTGPLALNQAGVTAGDAIRTATSAPDPAIRGISDLRVEGVGHVAGTNQPPSDFVEVVSTQVRTYLERTHAAHTEALTALVGR